MPFDPVETWKTMRVRVWPEEYFIVDLPHREGEMALSLLQHSSGRFCSITRDQFAFSIVVDRTTWEERGKEDRADRCLGPLRVLSTDSDLPFDVPGFIRTALEPVNARKLKAAPICGLQSDHFFTGAADVSKVAAIFETFCREVVFVPESGAG